MKVFAPEENVELNDCKILKGSLYGNMREEEEAGPSV